MNPTRSTVSTKALSRRTLLRGALGGLTAGIALPPLEAMVGRAGTAHAQAAPRADRFVFFHFPNGAYMVDWIPDTVGSGYTPGEQLAPLAELRSEFKLVSGLSNLHGLSPGTADGFGSPHDVPAAMLATGLGVQRAPSVTVSGPSIDHVVSQHFAGRARIPALRVAPYTRDPSGGGVKPISFSGPGAPLPWQADPVLLFRQLFLSSTDAAAYNALAAQRRSVLDLVQRDIAGLTARLGAADRGRLDQHLASVRDLEQTLAAPATSCSAPSTPLLSGVTALPTTIDAKLDALIDLALIALRCDITRVLVVSAGGSQVDFMYPFLATPELGSPVTGDHQLSHLNGGRNETDPARRNALAYGWYKRITWWKMSKFARLLRGLRDTRDAAGQPLLARTATVCASELAGGASHSRWNLPVLVAGAGLRGGDHVHFPCDTSPSVFATLPLPRPAIASNERAPLVRMCNTGGANTPLSNLWLSVLRAVGAPGDRFGESTGPLGGIWA